MSEYERIGELNEELTDIADGQFMHPYLYYGEFYEVETTDEGTIWLDTNDYGNDAAKAVKDSGITPIDTNEIETVCGWYAYTSAPGYVDRYDLGMFKTEIEALEALIEYYE